MHSSSETRRPRSIEIDGINHGNAPIPMGARVGHLLYSSALMGKDPMTNALPAAAEAQAHHLFNNLRTLLTNGGAALEDVVFVKAYLADNSLREVLNKHWIRCFPDEHDRPARHVQITKLPTGMLLQIEIVAVIATSR